MIPGLGMIIGLGGGVIRDVVQVFADRSNKKLEAELEMQNFKERQQILSEYEKQRSAVNLQTAQIESSTEALRVEGITVQSNAQVGVEQEKTNQAWLSAVKDVSSYVQGNGWLPNFSNFIIAFIRPAISIYLLWFLYKIYNTNITTHPEWMQSFIEYILTFTETIISFWFYARSTEKASLSKKKL